MYDKMIRAKNITANQLEDILDRFHKKQVSAKKKNYTWLIVIVSILTLAAIGFAVYKFFFAPIDDYDDYDDFDDYDDIDFDDDFEEDDSEEDDDEEVDITE